MNLGGGFEAPGYACCVCWGCPCCCTGFGDNAKYMPVHVAARATMVITVTYDNNRERKRPALPLPPNRHVMFRGAYYIGGPAVPSEVLDAIADLLRRRTIVRVKAQHVAD